jgi:hypothetical protein
MKKKLSIRVLFLSIFSAFVFIVNVLAYENEGLDLIEPEMDVDLVVLRNNQSTTVTADLGFPLDFEIVPVALIGNGNFSMSLSRTNTTGEIVYIGYYGFGTPISGINVGISPVTLRLSSTVYDGNSYGVGIIYHGILLSSEDPPYEYSLSLSF